MVQICRFYEISFPCLVTMRAAYDFAFLTAVYSFYIIIQRFVTKITFKIPQNLLSKILRDTSWIYSMWHRTMKWAYYKYILMIKIEHFKHISNLSRCIRHLWNTYTLYGLLWKHFCFFTQITSFPLFLEKRGLKLIECLEQRKFLCSIISMKWNGWCFCWLR